MASSIDESRPEPTKPGPAAPGPPPWLRWEVWLVLAIAVSPWTANALWDLARNLLGGFSPAQNPVTIPGHPAVDVGLFLVVMVAQASPVLLVGFLLARSGESMQGLGLNARHMRGTFGLAAVLVVGLFVSWAVVNPVMGALHIPNLSRTVGPDGSGWYSLELFAAAARAGLMEEVIVCGYLLHRLRQLGWSDRKALAASTAVRASYHVYGGLPLVLFTIPMGLVFGRIYQRSQRLLALVIAHAVYDGIVFALILRAR